MFSAVGSFSKGWIFILLVYLFVSGCPRLSEPPDAPGEEASPPISIPDYFPLAVGNSWRFDYHLYSTQKAAIAVAMAVEDKTEIDGHEIWQVRVDTPWYVSWPLRWLLGSEGRVFAVRVDDHFYCTPNYADLEGLPETERLTLLPISVTVRPGVVQETWDGKPLWAKYHLGSQAEVWPSDADPALLGPAIGPYPDCVGIATLKPDGVWNETTVILARSAGPVYVRTKFGMFYLREADLAHGEEPEGGTDLSVARPTVKRSWGGVS